MQRCMKREVHKSDVSSHILADKLEQQVKRKHTGYKLPDYI